MTEEERLILVLVKIDFPLMDESDVLNISPHQRRGYLAQVTRFLRLVEIFGYYRNEVESDIELIHNGGE